MHNYFVWLLLLCGSMYGTLSQKSLQQLEHYSRIHELTIEDLDKWDSLWERFCTYKRISLSEQLRVASYVYTAQKQALDISYLHHHSTCSLDPITLGIFSLFYPDMTYPQHFVHDPYSHMLASYLIPQFQKRKECDHPILWEPDGEKYHVPAPKDESLHKVLRYQRIRRQQDREIAEFWHTHQTWYKLAHCGMNNLYDIVLTKMLMTQAMYDACCIALHHQERYRVLPLHCLDQRVVPLYDTLSWRYPSSHTAVMAAATTILRQRIGSKALLSQCSRQAFYSRWYTGLECGRDMKEGKKLGIYIGKRYLSKARDHALHTEAKVID